MCSLIPESCRKPETAVIDQSDGGNRIADSRFDDVGGVSNCCETVVKVLWSVASLSAHGFAPKWTDLIEDVLVHKSFLGNRVAHDVSDTENGASVGLRCQEGRNTKPRSVFFMLIPFG